MNARREAAFDRTPLAAAVRVNAARVVKETFDRLSAGERTVGAKILLTRFVERCADVAESGDWSGLTRWAGDACERYGAILPAERVLSAALRPLADAFQRGTDDITARRYDRASGALLLVLGNARAGAATGNVEAVDECDVALDVLIDKLDAYDPLTAEHSRAVGSWCARLAKRLGDGKNEAVQLARAGLIHDVGKLSTPPEILIAPRRLTDEETAVMQAHTTAGERIVRDTPLIATFAVSVRSHHERFDGRGYPDGLRWDTIPREARIVSVADAFNAMIGRRPYRAPLAPSAALDELVGGRGGQFDPDVVDAMIEVVTEHA